MANKEFLENYRAEILGYDLIENIYLNEEELLWCCNSSNGGNSNCNDYVF